MSPLLEVEHLDVTYRGGGWLSRQRSFTQAVDDVSFSVAAGETFGLVGESGSGKSSVGKAILRLVTPQGGAIRFDGRDLAAMGRHTPLSYRRDVQVVFQDPWSSLNPRSVVGQILAEPLRRHDRVPRQGERAEVIRLLDQVGLAPIHADRLPRELSGGQRQRVAIARALAVGPRLIVCDEPVSALDVSTQAQVVNLLADLQSEHGLSYVFIAHDLSVARHISHRVGVMFGGRLVEVRAADEIRREPRHPYTLELRDAEPLPDPARQRALRSVRRDAPNAAPDVGLPGNREGCLYRNRCPAAMPTCTTQRPEPIVHGDGTVACHAVAAQVHRWPQDA